MRTSHWLVAIAILFVCARTTVGGEAPGAVTQLMFKTHVYQGDPLGSVEAGTIKVLAEPILVTTEKRPFSIQLGGEKPVLSDPEIEFIVSGFSLKGTPGIARDGKLQLDLTVTNTMIIENTENRLQVQSESTRTVSTVKEGEVTKFRIGTPEPGTDAQLWMEFTYELVKPLKVQ